MIVMDTKEEAVRWLYALYCRDIGSEGAVTMWDNLPNRARKAWEAVLNRAKLVEVAQGGITAAAVPTHLRVVIQKAIAVMKAIEKLNNASDYACDVLKAELIRLMKELP